MIDRLLNDYDYDTKRKLELVRAMDLVKASQKMPTVNQQVMTLEGLAAEMPSSLIPAYTGKAHVWADRVENIIKAKGFGELTSDIVSQAFLPVVLSKLPPDIARDAPDGDLPAVLAYLRNVDKIRWDLNQCFVEGRKLEKSPSQAFNALVNRARKTLPALDAEGNPDKSGTTCTELHIKTVAWTSLKAGLPPALLALATALGIRYFPTTQNLEILDEAWADHNAQKEIPSVFSITKEESTATAATIVPKKTENKQLAQIQGMLNYQADRMCRIEQAMNTEAAKVTAIQGTNNQRANNGQRAAFQPRAGRNPRWNNRPNYNSQQNSPAPRNNGYQRGGMSYAAAARPNNEQFQQQQTADMQQRTQSEDRNFAPQQPRNNTRPRTFPAPVYPNRLDFCFYHRTFGRDARNHELPCAWIFPANNK